MNPLNDRQFTRLDESIDWSSQQFAFPRRKRIEAIKQLAGHHYMERGAELPVPVNFIKLARDIYGRLLAPKAPRAMMTTRNREQKFTAANFELAVNQIPKEINLAETLRRLVDEALFSMGILRIGISTVGEVMGFDYGKIFADLITLDDYFCDMTVKYWKEIQYEGNDYWLDYEKAMDSKWINKEARMHLKADNYEMIGPQGEDRAENIQQSGSPKLFKDKLWCRDVWLPDEKLLVTYGITSKKRFGIIEWDGPNHSPYYKLGFSNVPGNILFLPPVSVWRDLHELGNAIFRKLGDQADSQKTVQGFGGGNDASVTAFKNARDGDGITYQGPEPKILKAGGVDQVTLAFYLQSRDLSSYFAGNVDSVGGLAPMTETVGQDKLLSEAANAQLRDMAGSVTTFSQDVFEALAWYEWHDPISERMLDKPVPGMPGMTIPTKWNRESRVGEIDLFNLEIDVYSMQDDSPSAKLQRLGLVMERYMNPLRPDIERMGGTIDAQQIVETVAKWSDLPELNEIVTFVQPSPQPGMEQKSGMPANTSREYVHSSRPGMTRQGASNTMQQILMGGNVQDTQGQQLADRGLM